MIHDKTAQSLYSTLTGGTALTALLAGTTSVYHMQAPDNATLPYIVFNHQGGGPENLDPHRLENNLWYVRAYSSTSAKTAAEIYRQADLLLNHVNLSMAGYNTFWGAREENIQTIETLPNNKKIWGAGGIYRIRTSDYTGFDWYVDSVNGSDSNDGRTADEAFATIAKLLTVMVAGESVGLAKGSHWREQLTLPGNNCTVASYGSGARPILDASNVASGWAKTAGQTNVYEISVTPEWAASDNWLNVFEDDAFLARVANLATCDSTPGSYYPSAATGTITIYIHTSGSDNPTTNGSIYEYTHRLAGIDCRAYDGCVITGIHTMKSLLTSGSLICGTRTIITNCLSEYGSEHNVYIRDGSSCDSLTASEAYFGTSSCELIFYTDVAPTGLGLTFTDCNATMSTYNSLVSGYWGSRHDAGTSFGVVTYIDCQVSNCNVGFSSIDTDETILIRPIVNNCAYHFRLDGDAPWTITDPVCTGLCTRLIFVYAGAPIITMSGADVDVDCSGSSLIYNHQGGTITITNSNFRGTSFASANRIFYINHASVNIDISNCVFGNGFSNVYYCPIIDGFISDQNCFDDNTEVFNINGAVYTTVAAYQAGTGQDANSTIGGCGS